MTEHATSNRRYRIEAKTMWTAICNACGKDILDYDYSEHVAYTDPGSVGEVIESWDGYGRCRHCQAPLTDDEAELQAELDEDAK